MEIIRKYKKFSCGKFLNLIEIEIEHGQLSLEDFYTFFDELKLKKLESISEGEIFKIKKTARKLLDHLEEKILKLADFASPSDIEQLRQMAQKI